MSLIIALNKSYHSYFNPKYQGTLNPNKQFRPIRNPKDSTLKNELRKYEMNKEDHASRTVYCAKNIMSDNVWEISSESTVNDGLIKMKKYAIHHLLVEEAGALVAIVTDRDLLKNSSISNIKLSDIMNKNVLMCKEDTRIPLIAKVMLEEQVSSILVVNDEYVRKGIITRSDLLNFIVRNLSLNDFA